MVKVEDRNQSQQKLQVIIKSIKLMNYTLQITSNQKIFKPGFQWLTDIIRTETINVNRYLYQANNLDLYKYYNERNQLQRQALGLCKTIKGDILVAKKTFKLTSKRVTYWTRFVNEQINLIEKWMESDYKRYKEKEKKDNK